jgi:hypothetical protein
LDFSEIGIVSSLTQPLAESGVSVFLISTFDTDYLMVKEKNLAETIDVLTAAGHEVVTEDRGHKHRCQVSGVRCQNKQAET